MLRGIGRSLGNQFSYIQREKKDYKQGINRVRLMGGTHQTFQT
jgi:hypothetical protein